MHLCKVQGSKLREVVSQKQAVQRIPPLILEHEIIPFRNDVRNGATSVGLAEGHAAVHASGGLIPELVLTVSGRNFFPVLDTLASGAIRLVDPLVFHKASHFVQLLHALTSSHHITPNLPDQR
jgi:hypothetical protein